jgi:hypothetical protein
VHLVHVGLVAVDDEVGAVSHLLEAECGESNEKYENMPVLVVSLPC